MDVFSILSYFFIVQLNRHSQTILRKYKKTRHCMRHFPTLYHFLSFFSKKLIFSQMSGPKTIHLSLWKTFFYDQRHIQAQSHDQVRFYNRCGASQYRGILHSIELFFAQQFFSGLFNNLEHIEVVYATMMKKPIDAALCLPISRKISSRLQCLMFFVNPIYSFIWYIYLQKIYRDSNV